MKMKSFYFKIASVLLCIGASLSTLQAESPDPQEIQPRVEIGTRPFSLIEHTTLQEERLAEEKEELAQQVNHPEALANQSEEEEELTAKGFPFTTSTLITTHSGIYQSPIAVSALGDTTEFTDGSIWNIRSNDRYKTFDWLPSHQIIVKPSHCWFSSYHYKITNLTTKVSVAANLSLGPIYNGVHTHWIAAIDYQNRQVCLEDGTVWRLKKSDRAAINKWIVNDTVIIGVNDGYFTSKSNPNILINVNVLNYARGAVMY